MINTKPMKKELFTPRFIELSSKRYAKTKCWIWPRGRISSGYAQVYCDGKRKLVHRISYEAHNGSIPEGMIVCHSCDVPLCVNPDHLFIGTRKDSQRDCAQKEQNSRGFYKGHTLSKGPRIRLLTAAQVLEIRQSTESLREIAFKYSITPSYACLVRKGTRKGLVG
jgi:hypothetical protein